MYISYPFCKLIKSYNTVEYNKSMHFNSCVDHSYMLQLLKLNSSLIFFCNLKIYFHILVTNAEILPHNELHKREVLRANIEHKKSNLFCSLSLYSMCWHCRLCVRWLWIHSCWKQIKTEQWPTCSFAQVYLHCCRAGLDHGKITSALLLSM